MNGDRIRVRRENNMSGNPREHVKDKGFWDGGAGGHGGNGESGGRPSGFPGDRTPSRVGVRTDLEFPAGETASESDEIFTRR
jgi:hypothetical protein